MKKILFTIAALTSFAASAQVVEFPRNGFTPSRVTTAQRDAFLDTPGLKGPAKGLIIFNTTTNTLQVNIGTAAAPVWQDQQAAHNNDAIADCNKNVTTIQTITSSTGKVWMDRNLGASRAAQSKTDHYAYGCLYQWGRKTDGHEGIVWHSATTGTPINGTTTTLNDDPRHSLFITNNSTSPYDWRITQNNTLWGGATRAASPNDPCPTGFRVPKMTEIEAEFSAYGITNNPGADDMAYNSIHKFVQAGYRSEQAGALLIDVGVFGVLLSSSIIGTEAKFGNFFPTNSYSTSNARAKGYSIRCIKDINY